LDVSYLLAFLGFAALIVLHEAGHFTAAKLVGMRVERFSLFFGPMFVKRRIGETEYGIGFIPLGGYVKISGMNPDEPLPPDVAPRAYCNMPVWKRVFVIAAGPFVNIALAFLLVWCLLVFVGPSTGSTRVDSVLHPSPAAGLLHPGDQILSVDGVRGGQTALRNQIGTHRCTGRQYNGCVAAIPARIVVRRDGRRYAFNVRPRYNAADHRPLVGFIFGTTNVPVGAGDAASLSITGIWNATTSTVSAVARLFEPKERAQLHGVVGVYTYEQKSINRSSALALWVLALISLSLGIINLFPFLPLDGGHIFWALAEKVRGRRISYAVMERAGFIGAALIVMLFVIGLSNDIHTLSGPGFNP
jgi:regulator of sigma E protease